MEDGMDFVSFMKRYCVINSKRLCDRWAHMCYTGKTCKTYWKLSQTLHMEKCYKSNFLRPKNLEVCIICV